MKTMTLMNCTYKLERITKKAYRVACYDGGVFSWATATVGDIKKAQSLFNNIRKTLRFV